MPSVTEACTKLSRCSSPLLPNSIQPLAATALNPISSDETELYSISSEQEIKM